MAAHTMKRTEGHCRRTLRAQYANTHEPCLVADGVVRVRRGVRIPADLVQPDGGIMAELAASPRLQMKRRRVHSGGNLKSITHKRGRRENRVSDKSTFKVNRSGLAVSGI